MGGAATTESMPTSWILAALVMVASVTAAPTLLDKHPADGIVPESELQLFQTDAGDITTLAEAKEHIQALMKVGKTEKQCLEMAEAGEDAVKHAVKTEQAILDVLPDGKECLTKGDKEVEAARVDHHEAKKNTKVKKTIYHEAKTAMVHFSFPLDVLDNTDDMEALIKNYHTYKNADRTKSQAKVKYEVTQGVETAAHHAHQGAKEAAKISKHTCLCQTKQTHHKAFAAATKNVDTKENEMEWRKAHLLKCALED